MDICGGGLRHERAFHTLFPSSPPKKNALLTYIYNNNNNYYSSSSFNMRDFRGRLMEESMSPRHQN